VKKLLKNELMKIIFIFILLVSVTSLAKAKKVANDEKPVPGDYLVLVKASTACAEDVYIIPKAEKPDKTTIQNLTWILHYSLAESRVGKCEFSADTGKIIKTSELDAKLKKFDNKFLALKEPLTGIENLRYEMEKIRKTIGKEDFSYTECEKLAARYGEAQKKLLDELEKLFKVKPFNTFSSSCD
jgi:hypothetical protein